MATGHMFGLVIGTDDETEHPTGPGQQHGFPDRVVAAPLQEGAGIVVRAV